MLQMIVGAILLVAAVAFLLIGANVSSTNDTLRVSLLGLGLTTTVAGTSTFTGAYGRRDSHRREGH